ncbi:MULTISPECIES: AMP-dependent synthetase/ligase [Shewanella]|uniref:Long-chain fatty acid--CoA ligase n=1 Tax=Shewanella psychromarinicola TaxID=2487742 RepID=A0A3N4ETC3_9GAMM|nr:long-chain fatty acid--CoA ligase [Shewanella psychromarinicola]AZG34268.1 long-chain fatty acid--CoA ligase [Shewanella psychromarinicola]MCL1083544.1 long-chain fatty acid--CoA ligase [Shewanella psychromarinicola]RPA32364.1 long-chain fatty acid--CoA ligase [Shewanella psychromarinicola]
MSLDQYHVVRLMQQQSQLLTNNIALEGFDMPAPWHTVTWNAFNTVTDSVAQLLIKFGLQVQDKVVILAQNCPQWTCADIGALKARNVVVPVYPTSTIDQAAFIVNDAQAKLIFAGNQQQYDMACAVAAQADCVKHIVVFDANVSLNSDNHVYFDHLLTTQFNPSIAQELAARLDAADLNDLFTLIYTSGTTGNPKGVMLDYRNFASMINQHDSKLAFTPGDVSLAFLPLSHVFERGWTMYVLCRGGHNVYLNDTNRIKEALVAVKPHTLCVVPRFLEKIYSAVHDKVGQAPKARQALFAWAIKVGKRQFEVSQGRASGSLWLSAQWKLANKLVYRKLQQVLGGRLKFMPVGGAALDVNVGDFFHSISVPVLCGYGMTETSATVTCNTLDNRVPGSNGQPLDGMEIKLGKDDEILVRGDTVMRGYYNRPEDTAEAFEDGWLKTGDAGRIDEQGNLFMTDRIKELMKTSNGKYIAPQRVEGKVGCCPFIEQVAIIADARNYVSALIVPAFSALESWAHAQGIYVENPIDLLRHSQVVAHFEQRLKELQHELAGFEKIKKFTLLHEAFSMEAGLITPTLKLRRKMIYSKYHNEINAMYGK